MKHIFRKQHFTDLQNARQKSSNRKQNIFIFYAVNVWICFLDGNVSSVVEAKTNCFLAV